MKGKITLVTLLLLAGMNGVTKAQSKDYRSQVLFMYNFIKYINWPTSTEQFVIGVFGESPISSELNKLASIKKTPDGKVIVIKQIDNMTTVNLCNMIYIADARSKDIGQLASAIQTHPVLIVAERDGLAKRGAEINFFTLEDDKLGFALNRKAMEGKKLKASGELIRLAELAD